MGNFNKKEYDSNYAKQHLERCVFDVPKGTRKPLQDEIKARYGISLAEHVKSLLCRDLGLTDLSELVGGGGAKWRMKKTLIEGLSVCI